jgi:predicted ATPase
MFTSLHIHGLRGFAVEQTLRLAIPNGSLGSGLTVIVGANNAGKSTAIEAFRALGQRQSPSFTQGRRNIAAGDEVKINLVDSEGRTARLSSVRSGSSETNVESDFNPEELSRRLLVLPSRRTFNPYFNKSVTTRDDYMVNIGFPTVRSGGLDQFTYRLFAIEQNRGAFDAVLSKVLDPVPDWSIDQMDSGQYFLKIRSGTAVHSSEGLGEGLVSLLYIVDALYDSRELDLIAIDEPELSLHPALQRRVSSLLLEYSATRQIVIATHSPYMVHLDALPNGATIARAHIKDGGTVFSQLSPETAARVFGLMRNQNNPHILGLNAQEIFFVPDQIVLVEGQEDVVFLERVQESLGVKLDGNIFGWGVGGAENMEHVAHILHELEFAKVVGVLDGNRAELARRLAQRLPKFHFFAIAADDIRTKHAAKEKPGVLGLLDENNLSVREEYKLDTVQKFEAANAYLAATVP